VKQILVATKNQNKLKEIRELLSDLDTHVIGVTDIAVTVPNIVEDGKTFEENACKKALQIAQSTKFCTLADDSGLCVDHLDGAPGIFSARYAGTKNDQDNITKLLHELHGVPMAERNAHFVCAIAFATPDKIVGVVQGTCNGTISQSAAGVNGFGYDPVFFYPHFGKTFAEISPELKNAVSHRAIALQKIKVLINNFFLSTESS
jgi:XTP/dITP diphosphohydrolase